MIERAFDRGSDMGYRGKVEAQARARELRAQAWTLQQIADELGVAKSSVSLWVRDVPFTPRPRDPGAARRREPNVLQRRKQAEIDELLAVGRERIGRRGGRSFDPKDEAHPWVRRRGIRVQPNASCNQSWVSCTVCSVTGRARPSDRASTASARVDPASFRGSSTGGAIDC
jgi:hypothetical protein